MRRTSAARGVAGVARGAAHGGAVVTTQKKLPTMAPPQSLDRCRCRTKHAHAWHGHVSQVFGDVPRYALGRLRALAFTAYLHEPRKGRVAELTPRRQLVFGKGTIVVMRGALQAEMIGLQGLNEHAPRAIAAASTSGHLREQLERPFASAKIGKVERQVGQQHADQCHPRDIVSLSD